jgi:poly-gamma-glutamate system protein
MKYKWLMGVLTILVIGYLFLVMSQKRDVDHLYELKKISSNNLAAMFERVKAYRLELDGQLDRTLDINDTGIIGLRYSGITTTIGSIESKRTTANPNIAALVIELMVEAGLNKGDTIAVNLSGSFPGLNLAVIAASEAIGVKPYILSSIGASTYGANHLDLTYLDMERKLFEEGIIHEKSMAFSYGGAGDIGVDLDIDALETIRNRNGDKDFIYFEDLEDNIDYRMALYYKNNRDIDLFINVGGNMVSGGENDIDFGFKNGYIDPALKLNYSKSGLIGAFLQRGVGVVNLLDIKDLAIEHGLQIDPVPMPAISEETIFYTFKLSGILIMILLILSGGGIFYYGYIRRCEIKDKLKYIKS